MREEVLQVEFAALLDRPVFDEEVLDWVREALTASHEDERRAHDEAVARLQADYARLQNRLDTMYVDKLDGRIDASAFDRLASKWREDQAECLRLVRQHQAANQSYMAEGVRLLELARSARILFDRQQPDEKRRLLDFLVSNCTWRDGRLSAEFRQPFDLLADATRSNADEAGTAMPVFPKKEIWLLR